ncbi:fibrinogen-like protein 1 [Drosophila willistoni]|uniref:fibrinogen-like protein 1 n=1 Tax=Drosophila willistoni TaxID=7260 RepID=UPI001F0732BC|nr:fibrinogen-like protein 1 [Drosophila willistoni]
MRRDLSLFLLLAHFIFYVESTPYSRNETEAHIKAQELGESYSDAKMCYHNVKPLLQFASDCDNKNKDLNLAINQKDHELKDLFKKVENLNLTISHLNNDLQNSQSALKETTKTILNLKSESEDSLTNLKQELEKSRKDLQSALIQLKNLTKINKIQEEQLNSMDDTQADKFEVCSNENSVINVPVRYSWKGICKSNNAGSGWILIQRRINDEIDFNRNWQEYKFGFGNLNSSFFVGLEFLHSMTSTQTYELYIEITDKNNVTTYAKYDNFIVGSEEEAYQLKSLGNYTGTAGDSLSSLEKMHFSTIDRDNDQSPNGNCAQQFKGGWWFQNCTNSCLNGNYNLGAEYSQHFRRHGNHYHHNGRPGHIHHRHYGHGHHGQLTNHRLIWDNQTLSFAQMMIRKKSGEQIKL